MAEPAARGGVGFRMYVAGGQDVRQEFDKTADAGKKMFNEIAAGQREAVPGVKQLSDAMGDGARKADGMGDSVGGLAGKAGALGAVLGGVVTAAVAGFGLALMKTREALAFGDEIQDTAERLHISAEALQVWRFAAEEAGLEASAFESSFSKLSEAVGKAQSRMQGSKSIIQTFGLLGITEKEIDQVRNVEELLPRIAEGLRQVESDAQRAAIADKLGLEPLLPLLERGADGIADIADEARRLGIVLDNETVARMAELNREVEVAAQAIDVNLKAAFVNLGPVLVELSKMIAGLAQELDYFLDKFDAAERRSTANLERQRGEILDRMYRSETFAAGLAGGSAVHDGQMAQWRAQLAEIDAALGSRERARQAGGTAGPPVRPTIQATPRAGGRGRTAKPKGIDVSPIDVVGAYDPVTGRAIPAWSEADLMAERLTGMRPYDAQRFRRDVVEPVKVPVDFVPAGEGLAEGNELFERLEDRTERAFASGIRHVLEGGSIWELFRERLMDSAVDGLASAMTQLWKKSGGQTGGGGILGTILDVGVSILGGGSTSGWGSRIWPSDPVIKNVVGRKAAGGELDAGEASRLAEYGAEVAVFHRDGRVFSHDDTVRMLQEAAGGGRGPGLVVNSPVSINLDARGADPAQLGLLQQQLAQLQHNLPAVIVQTVNDGINRRTIGA